jgi:hypothetical protein
VKVSGVSNKKIQITKNKFVISGLSGYRLLKVISLLFMQKN